MNKKIISLAVLSCMLILNSAFKRDVNCTPYYPIKQGAVIVMKTYNEKDKLTSSTTNTVLAATSSGDSLILSMKSYMTDDKGKQLSEVSFTAKCTGGAFYINMATMVDPQQTKAHANMKMTITGDYLDLPSSPNAGQQLNGGTLVVSFTTPITMNVTTTVSNRKVEAMESKTTPAGTFDCVRLSFDVQTKAIFNVNAHVVEWYSKNVGMVRQERYSSKGKIEGYTVLDSITGN